MDKDAYSGLVDKGCEAFGGNLYAKALEHFWAAFRLCPSSTQVLFNIGRTMEALHDSQAIHFYEAAATQGFVDAAYQLSQIYLMSGDNDKAEKHLKAYLDKNKDVDDEFTRKVKEDLEELHPMPKLVWSNGKRLTSREKDFDPDTCDTNPLI